MTIPPDLVLEQAITAMQTFSGRWGIAGGWVISLCVGRVLRAHADVDVAVLRADQQYVRRKLRPDAARIVENGRLTPWDMRAAIAPPIHELHLSWRNGEQLELLLNESDSRTNEWLYRRDPRVRRPLQDTFMELRGIPCLTPEIVLLYKSKVPRLQDEADLLAVLPKLSKTQRSWLHDALELTTPGHPWAAVAAREA